MHDAPGHESKSSNSVASSLVLCGIGRCIRKRGPLKRARWCLGDNAQVRHTTHRLERAPAVSVMTRSCHGQALYSRRRRAQPALRALIDCLLDRDESSVKGRAAT